jgi:predicted phosphoadenosine phosphosulfate sulfurtransferase
VYEQIQGDAVKTIMRYEWIERERDLLLWQVSKMLGEKVPGNQNQKPWVSRLTGIKDKQWFEREFIEGQLDYSQSNSKGSRGVALVFSVDTNNVYEVRYYASRSREVRKFLYITQAGETIQLSREEAMEKVSDTRLPKTESNIVPAPPPTFISSTKLALNLNVLEAAQARIRYLFDNFPKICLSFSGGKDSTVLFHLMAAEARASNRKFGVLLIDLEAQYEATMKHCEAMMAEHQDCIEPYWIALPLILRNAVSMEEPRWIAWDQGKKQDWVRNPPALAITNPDQFPFFRHGMEFEEFTAAFAQWFSGGDLTASVIGIRADESLNRYRAIAGDYSRFEGKKWTTYKGGCCYNAYPIYDWSTEDIWVYHGKTGQIHNPIYDLMHKAGLSIHQMRICQPYGDDQRKGLWLFHVLEPQTWPRVVARVNGANSGAMYAHLPGNMMGNVRVKLPAGHSWESYARFLLNSLPPNAQEHYTVKIETFLRWYEARGYKHGIPDEADPKEEADRKTPSWRRIVKVLLKNDWWCKGLSFSQQKSEAYENYMKILKKRRQLWNPIFSRLS